MSADEFADSLGAESAALVGRWERGQAQPDYGTLAKIAAMGLVDVLVFHEQGPMDELPQLAPGEASELRQILTQMEGLLAQARTLVERAENRTAVEVLEAASAAPARLAEPETKRRSRVASASRTPKKASGPRTRKKASTTAS